MHNPFISLLGVFVTAGIVALIILLTGRNDPKPVQPAQSIGTIDLLAPTAAGLPAIPGVPKPAPATRADAYLGGTKSIGRVATVYLKVGESVFIAQDQAPATLRNIAERWVDVEFPELLANGSGDARAFIGTGQDAVEVGDLVEIKFAHKTNQLNARVFPVREITRVTERVAKRGEMLARDYERRILARNGHGAPDAEVQLSQRTGGRPDWLLPAQNSPIDFTRSSQAASIGR